MTVRYVDELREIAQWFRLRGDKGNAEFQDGAADALQAAGEFFAWFNRHYPAPSINPEHQWNRLGVALMPEDGPDEQTTENDHISYPGIPDSSVPSVSISLDLVRRILERLEYTGPSWAEHRSGVAAELRAELVSTR